MFENLEQVPLLTKIRKTDCPREEGEPQMWVPRAACLCSAGRDQDQPWQVLVMASATDYFVQSLLSSEALLRVGIKI